MFEPTVQETLGALVGLLPPSLLDDIGASYSAIRYGDEQHHSALDWRMIPLTPFWTTTGDACET